MPKRKRDYASDDNDSGSTQNQPSVRQKRVHFKINEGLKKLSHAFKVAKAFEKAKLGRRRKIAQNHKPGGEEIERIDAELAAAKVLDTSRTAQHHLSKSLTKVKAIAHHPDLPDSVRHPGTLTTHPPTLNVNARLCKSKPVQECMRAVLDDVQHSLGVHVENVVEVKKHRVRAKDFKATDDGRSSGSSGNKPDAESEALTSGHVGKHGDGRPIARALNISGEEDESAFPEHEDRIASSDEDDDDDDDDDVGDNEEDVHASNTTDIAALERQLADEGIKRKPRSSSAAANQPNTNQKAYDLEADLSLSSASDAENSDSGPPEPSKASSSNAAPNKSSFIPSLTLGGYISGSASDVDFDNEVADVAPRKNRRGQRARQAIWEMKYGQRANHLHKPEKPGAARGQGWDAKRGATDGREARGSSGKSGRGHGGRGGGMGRVGDRSFRGRRGDGQAPSQVGAVGDKKHRDDGGALHPSWEAAKKAKEQKNKPVAFKGKKITFD